MAAVDVTATSDLQLPLVDRFCFLIMQFHASLNGADDKVWSHLSQAYLFRTIIVEDYI